MDKQTLSHYGWIIIMVLILSVMLAFATPFGKYVGRGVSNIAMSIVGANDDAVDEGNIGQMGKEWDDYLNGENPNINDDNVNPEVPTGCKHTNTTKINTKSATCTANGYTGDTYCNDCKATISTGASIPATGHKNTTIINASATYTGDTYCNDCKTIIGSGTNIPTNTVGEAGLYDANDNLLADWNTLVNDYGLDIKIGYTMSSYNIDTNSLHYIINHNNKFSTAVKLVISSEEDVICDYAFYNCDMLTTVIIPDGILSIGERAFCSMANLTSIEIPSSVTRIGQSAFGACSSLTNVVLNGRITSMGNDVFNGNRNITSLTISNNVKVIGTYAFRNCTGLTTVNIPDSVTTIGSYAFEGCENITSLTIGNSVKTIGSYAFQNCTGLTTITIPDSVTSIGAYAFADCVNIPSITFGENVAKIGNYAFKGCGSLRSAIFKNKNSWSVGTYTVNVTSASTAAEKLIRSSYYMFDWTRN